MARTTPESEIDRIAERINNQFEVESQSDFNVSFNKMFKLDEKELSQSQKTLRKKARGVFFKKKLLGKKGKLTKKESEQIARQLRREAKEK